MSRGERRWRSPDGREWIVSLDVPGSVMPVDPGLENAGAMLPEEAVNIVFRSGDETLREEYTMLAEVADLSDEQLTDWYEAAKRGKGL
ncbi:hypothetical protein BH23GEM4_BH23GEM4_07780 [soil metagenome]